MEPSAVSSEFAMHGMSLRSDAMRDVCSFLASQADVERALSQLLAALQAVNRACLRRARTVASRLPSKARRLSLRTLLFPPHFL
jgi:hypothetical protein